MSEDTNIQSLDSRLRAVWQRLQRRNLVAGFLEFIRWMILMTLAGIFLDWLTSFPVAIRWVLLLAIVLVSFVKAWRRGWRNLRGFDSVRVALETEKQEGGMESLLVTAVQMESGKKRGASEALWKATRDKAEETARGIKPHRVVGFRRLKKPGVIAGGLLAVMGVFAVMNGPFLSAGLARIFTPWVVVTYPTKTLLTPVEGDLVVKEGDSARVAMEVSGVVPDKAVLLLQTGEGDPREIELEIEGGICQYKIASASRDFSYQVKAGDTLSEWYQVQVITAPRIQQVKVALEYPEYLERSVETMEALTLTVPEETKVSWDLTLDRAVSDVVLHRDGKDPKPLEVGGDGRTLKMDEKVDASRGYRFAWTERENGFEFTSPRYYLQVATDQVPQVELSSPDSNLDALIGRELKLGIRARDDHGIGSASITYRVNLRPEKTVKLETPIENGGGEQMLDWDYRTALPDLKVGESVSFVVEVADRYPDGSHTARSETRRITFLSREDYLAQIEKKKDRLLSRVRTTYRQERAAHELVLKLDPAENSYLQTCQLEAIRQEMLRQQLKDIAAGVQTLLDDLAANNVTEAVELNTLEQVRDGLNSIAEQKVAKAASLLREQTGATGNELDPTESILVVNEAARALAALVLQRGIDFAREVFARESHMLASEQAKIRLLAIQAKEGKGMKELALRQLRLADWTAHLIKSLREGMRYDKRPISVLGLTRRIKELRASGAENDMKKAAELLESGKMIEAQSLQSGIVVPLMKSEFSMRTGAEYAAIMKFRANLDEVLGQLIGLREKCEGLDEAEFEKERDNLSVAQSDLQEVLVTSLLPPIPSPRARLFDQAFPDPLPIDETRAIAESAIAQALAHLAAGEKEKLIAAQQAAEEALVSFSEYLEESSLELSLRAQGLNRLVSTAIERVTLIEDFEERQISLLEKAEEAALDEVKSEALGEEQQFLVDEITDVQKDLLKDSEADGDVLPLLSRLEELVRVSSQAVAPLKANQPEEALEFQEEAADLLADSLELAMSQSDRLGLLQSLYSFQRSVGSASNWMTDIVDEQSDLVKETENAKPEDAARLLPVMKNLRQCYTDIAPVLDLVAGRLDAGTPLLFAGTDMEDAILAVEDEDFLDALDAQEVAAESLDEVRSLVEAVRRQTGYIAEIVEFLHSSQAEASLMAFQQNELRTNMKGAALATQEALQKRGVEYGRLLVRASGMAGFGEAGGQMREAALMLKSENSQGAKSQMELAEASLGAHAEELLLVISMLHGLPSIEMTSASAEELGVLLEVLALASNQRDLSRLMEKAGAVGMKNFKDRQVELEKKSSRTLEAVFAVAPVEEGEKYTQGVPPHPKLNAANQAYSRVNAAMEAGNFAEVRKSQEEIDDSLRHFIIEQALVLETAVAPAAASDDPVLSEAETDDLSESVAGFVSDFVAGEAPKDKKTEWEVLGNRDRAALNQNFARELPLEYRGTLKNYYERVAK